MLLNQKTLENITLGHLRTEVDEEGYLAFSRFTEAQKEYYAKRSPENELKIYATAGMRFDFHTDAEVFSFDYKMKIASSRLYYGMDLYVDGAMVRHYDPECKKPECEGSIAFALPEGFHRVTLYMPNLTCLSVKNAELEGATVLRAVKPTKKIFFVGDSITQGYDAVYPSLSYVNCLSRHFDAEVLNQAIGGEVFDPELVDTEMDFAPDLIVIAYGTNDWCNAPSREAILEKQAALIDKMKLLARAVHIVYVSPIWRGPEAIVKTPSGDFHETCEALAANASKKRIVSVNGMNLVPHLSDFFSDKALHPNDLGFLIYAENLAKELEKYIR